MLTNRKNTHVHQNPSGQRHTGIKKTNTDVTCLFRWVNVCPSGSVAAVSLTHSHTHTHTQAFCLSGVSGYSLLSLGQSLALTHTVCGVERRSVWLEVQLVKECLLSACEGWGRAKVPPPTPISYISFFLSSFSLSHPRTLLSSFSGSKRDVCAGACDCVRWAVNEVVYWLSNSLLQVATDWKLFSLTWNQFPEFLHSKTFNDKKCEAQRPSFSFKPGKVCEIFSFLFLRNRYLHVTVCFVLL